jgi:hypothetical protein
LQNGLKGKRERGLRFLSFSYTSDVSLEIKIAVLRGLCRASAAASNTQVNSKYYGKLASSSPQRVNRKRSRVVRAAAIAGVAG